MKICIISKKPLIIQNLKIILKDPTFQKYNITEISVNDHDCKDNKINKSSLIYLIDDKEDLFLSQTPIDSFKALIGVNFNPSIYYKYHFDYYLSETFDIKSLKDMMKVYETKKNKDNKIIVHSNYKIFQFNCHDIYYIERRNRKNYINTKDDTISIKDDFNILKLYLSSCGFIVPHYSFLVNPIYIISVDKTNLILENNTVIPISRSHKSKLANFYK